MQPQPIRLVSHVNRRMAVGCWALCAVVTTVIVANSTIRGQVAAVVLAAWLGFAIWAALWRPSLEIDDDAARIQNVLRTVHVPLAALVHVDTKFALTLITPHGRWAVWCAPQPGALAARRAIRRGKEDGSTQHPLAPRPRVGDVLGTESGDAAALVRERWQSVLRRAGAEGTNPDAERATVRWHAATIAVLVAGPVLSATVPLLF